MRGMTEMRSKQATDRRTPIAMTLSLGAGTALCAAVAVGGDTRPDRSFAPPVESSVIATNLESLDANCRTIAEKRLRRRMETKASGVLTILDVESAIRPLRRGGSTLCDVIEKQSLALETK